MKTLFVTATGYTQANSHIIWHYRNQIEKIVIISTVDSRKKQFVTNLSNLLATPEFGVSHVATDEVFLPSGIENTDVDAMKHQISNYIIKNNITNAIFNITGGVKLIALALDQISNLSSSYECVYQSAKNQLVWYNRDQNQIEDLTLQDDIVIRLKSQGYEVKRQESIREIMAKRLYDIQFSLKMYKFIREDIKEAQTLIHLLNVLVAQAQKQTNYPCTVKLDKNESWFDKHVNKLQELADTPEQPYFKIHADTRELELCCQEAVKFLNGEWFEILLATLVGKYFEEKDETTEVYVGLEFNQLSNGNEIDVAYVKSSHLNFFECKTVNWNGRTKPVNDALHKLTSISEGVGGVNYKKYFVTLFDISAEAKKVAKEKGIKIITASTFNNLDQILSYNIK